MKRQIQNKLNLKRVKRVKPVKPVKQFRDSGLYSTKINTIIMKDKYLDDSILQYPDKAYWLIKGGTGYGGTHTSLASSFPSIVITPNTSQVIGKQKSFTYSEKKIYVSYTEISDSKGEVEITQNNTLYRFPVYANTITDTSDDNNSIVGTFTKDGNNKTLYREYVTNSTNSTNNVIKYLFKEPYLDVAYIYSNSKVRWKDVENWVNNGDKFHVYTTYKNFEILRTSNSSLYEKLTKSHILIVDEAHSIISKEYMKSFNSITNAISLFNKAILTTATPPEFIGNRDLSNLPIYFHTKKEIESIHVDYYLNSNECIERDKCIEIRQCRDCLRTKKEVNWDIKHVKLLIKEIYDSNEHVLIFSNNNYHHKTLWEDTDHITGEGMKNKIQIFKKQEDFKNFDETKLVHLISSAGYEGLDFNFNAHVIVLTRFGDIDAVKHLSLTYNDFRQAIGRVRKKLLGVHFFLQTDKFYIEKLDEKVSNVPGYKEMYNLFK